MKNLKTPRTSAEFNWVQGHGPVEPLWEKVWGYALAFAIGAGMACLMVSWWSS